MRFPQVESMVNGPNGDPLAQTRHMKETAATPTPVVKETHAQDLPPMKVICQRSNQSRLLLLYVFIILGCPSLPKLSIDTNMQIWARIWTRQI